MLQANFMPSKEAVEGKPVKVAIFPLENNDLTVATKTNLGSAMAIDIENILIEDKLVDLVDRKASQKLMKEVELAEIKGDKIYEGPAVADYIISGSISKANFTSQYISAQHFFNKETGKYTYVPAKWNYVSEVGGNIKIYEIPSLGVVRIFEINGRSRMSENAKFRSRAKTEDDYLLREASRDGLDDIAVDLKNFFAKKGYILEKKVLNDRAIFKISLGFEDGIKQGDKLVVYEKREDKNSITGASEIIESKIAEGVVTDIINNKSSWILLKNRRDANKVRLGHIVQIKYKKTFWQKYGENSINTGIIAVKMINEVSNGSSVSF